MLKVAVTDLRVPRSSAVTVRMDSGEKEKTMSNYSNPALEAELAYRRQLLEQAGKRTSGRRWFSRRRSSR